VTLRHSRAGPDRVVGREDGVRVVAVAGDTVIGVVPREALAAVLSAVHRGGFGPLARLFDPERGPLDGQLRRAGLPAPAEAASSDRATVLLAVTAPGRAALVGDAISRAGAVRVYVTARGRIDAALDPVPLAGEPAGLHG